MLSGITVSNNSNGECTRHLKIFAVDSLSIHHRQQKTPEHELDAPGPSVTKERKKVKQRPANRTGRKAEGSSHSALSPNRVSLGWSPFHTAAKDYHKAGYLPIPLPEGKKYPPPKGVPNDVEYTEGRLEAWLRGEYEGREEKLDTRHKNLGCIVPDGTVVFDIDGAAARETLREMENELGPLPPTWASFRGDPDRFHLWYVCPEGTVWPGKLGKSHRFGFFQKIPVELACAQS